MCISTFCGETSSSIKHWGGLLNLTGVDVTLIVMLVFSMSSIWLTLAQVATHVLSLSQSHGKIFSDAGAPQLACCGLQLVKTAITN